MLLSNAGICFSAMRECYSDQDPALALLASCAGYYAARSNRAGGFDLGATSEARMKTTSETITKTTSETMTTTTSETMTMTTSETITMTARNDRTRSRRHRFGKSTAALGLRARAPNEGTTEGSSPREQTRMIKGDGRTKVSSRVYCTGLEARNKQASREKLKYTVQP